MSKAIHFPYALAVLAIAGWSSCLTSTSVAQDLRMNRAFDEESMDALELPVTEGVSESTPQHVHWPEVLTPDGEPAKGAELLSCQRAPVGVDLRIDGVVIQDLIAAPPEMIDDSLRSRRLKINADGFGLPGTNGLTDAKHVFGVHDSGYLNFPMDELKDKRQVRLEPWQIRSGLIRLHSIPLKTGVVIASWQPFPRKTGGWAGPPSSEDLPPMITLRVAAPVTKGEFRFVNLPSGRIRFMVFPDRQVSDDQIWVEESQFVWWETVDDAGLSDQQLSPPKDFRVTTVRGRIDNSTQVYSQRLNSATAAPGEAPKLQRLKLLFTPLAISKDKGFDQTSNVWASESFDDYSRDLAIWARPGGQREQQVVSPSVIVNDDLTFSATLLRGKYQASILTERKVNDEFEVWEDHGFSPFDVNVEPDRERDIPFQSLSLPTIDIGTQTLALVATPPSDLMDRPYAPPSVQQPSFVDTPKQRHDIAPLVPERGKFSRDAAPRPEPSQTPELRGYESDSPIDSSVTLVGRTPVPASQTEASPVDKAIAELVTGLLSAGDRRTRQNLEKPLKTLLEQKFDAEQQARESIVGELQKRLKNAEQKVQERATNKAAIVQQQLQRMMGLPEDGFLEMSPVENDRPFGDLSSNSDAELALNHLSQFTYPVPFQCDFTTVDQGGTPLRFLDYNGQTRLIYFWSLSDTSKLQLPALVKLQSKYEKYGFQIIGLHTSSSNDPSANHQLLREAIATAKINFPLGLMADATQQQVPGIYKNPEPPELLFIDDNNKVRLKVNGVKSDEYLAEVVEALLKEATRDRALEDDRRR